MCDRGRRQARCCCSIRRQSCWGLASHSLLLLRVHSGCPLRGPCRTLARLLEALLVGCGGIGLTLLQLLREQGLLLAVPM